MTSGRIGMLARLQGAAHRNTPWRRLRPARTVRRHIQGVDLYMPWSHRLPDYVTVRPHYGQNLVDLAAAISTTDAGGSPIQVLDIGANIGDSALQIVNSVDARVLCVEGDPFWIDYLRRNVGSDPRIEVEAALLIPEAEAWKGVHAVRSGGTTKFIGGDGSSNRRLTVQQLRDSHPEFRAVRLIKSDTDGFDTQLVPAVAKVFSASDPVLFFEFDPGLTRDVTGADANSVWAELSQLGYSHVAIWSNFGDPLGQLGIDLAASASSVMTNRSDPRHVYHYWDVAVRRPQDAAAAAVFDALNPAAFTLPSESLTD